METKTCSVCKEKKPLTQFRKDSSREDGIHRTCNDCNNVSQRQWYSRNKEKARRIASENYQKNKDAINAKRRQDRLNNPESVRAKANSHYNPINSKIRGWKQAGIKNMTYDKYLQMLEDQNNSCALCGRHKDSFKKQLSVDHNHSTGAVRGLLCASCNGGIGKLNDSIEMLEKAIKYLKNYE